MRFIKRLLPVFLLFLTVFVWKGTEAFASVPEENVSITVPAKLELVFESDGSVTTSEMYVENNSIVAIVLTNIKVTTNLGWELVPEGSTISVNQEQMSFKLGDWELKEGDNAVNYSIAASTRKNFSVSVGRGAWTKRMGVVGAMELEFDYEIGKTRFRINLDGNGIIQDSYSYFYNGTVITLPQYDKVEGYTFCGWQNEDGTICGETYVMPIGEVTLTAIWVKFYDYAIYCAEDGSFYLARTRQELAVGGTYQGKTITALYTGVEETDYKYASDVPWNVDGTNKKVTSVTAYGGISPISTAYWFYNFTKCMNFDLTNLNTSKVTTMTNMFFSTGQQEGVFQITGMEGWDTSNVTNMFSMFEYSGVNATEYQIGNVGVWDVSKVENGGRMFCKAGMHVEIIQIGDLSNWNTESMNNTIYMFEDFGSEATEVDIGNLGNWDVSKVTSMHAMFANFGMNAEKAYFGDLTDWNVGSVIVFNRMFAGCAKYVEDWYVGDLTNWDMSQANSLSDMFSETGRYSATFYLGNLSGWNTGNVKVMNNMFYRTAEMADWSQDCSSWNVEKITMHLNFNVGAEDKVTPPNWVS